MQSNPSSHSSSSPSPPSSVQQAKLLQLNRKLDQWRFLGRCWVRRAPSSTPSPRWPVPRRVHASPHLLLLATLHATVALCRNLILVQLGSAAAPPPPPPAPRASSSCGALLSSQSSVAQPQPRPTPSPAAPRLMPSRSVGQCRWLRLGQWCYQWLVSDATVRCCSCCRYRRCRYSRCRRHRHHRRYSAARIDRAAALDACETWPWLHVTACCGSNGCIRLHVHGHSRAFWQDRHDRQYAAWR